MKILLSVIYLVAEEGYGEEEADIVDEKKGSGEGKGSKNEGKGKTQEGKGERKRNKRAVRREEDQEKERQARAEKDASERRKIEKELGLTKGAGKEEVEEAERCYVLEVHVQPPRKRKLYLMKKSPYCFVSEYSKQPNGYFLAYERRDDSVLGINEQMVSRYSTLLEML